MLFAVLLALQADWLREQALPIRSLDFDADLADLEPLRKVVGDARIVQLGEQTHGDGAAFLAKARLVRFLHEKMGFDVLAFESGLYDCRKVWDAVRKGEENPFPRGVFGVWSRSEQVRPLLDYVARRADGDAPLELCGFDCQLTGSQDSLRADLEAWLKTTKADGADVLKGVATILDPKARPGESERVAIRAAFTELRNGLRWKAPRGEETEFWKQTLESLLGQAESQWAVAGTTGNLRDEQMAKNLIWLARERYPKRKIVVWAATMHLVRNAPSIDTLGIGFTYAKTVTMGQRVREAFGDQVLTIGFTAFEGMAGYAWQRPRDIGKAPEGSFEELCIKAGLENAIVPFRDADWLRKPLRARPLGYALMQADWTKVLDAMVFTRRMTPSTPRPEPPTAVEREALKDLGATLERMWTSMKEPKGPFAHKQNFAEVAELWIRTGAPVADAEKIAAGWHARHRDEPGFEWRARHLLGLLAAARKDASASEHFDRALAAYPDAEFENPMVHSAFQHLVNARAMAVWDRKGFEPALQESLALLEKEKRFRFFFADPWIDRLAREGDAAGVASLKARVRAAYEARSRALPDLADEIRRFRAQLE